MTVVKMLNYLPYSKDYAIDIMGRELDWRYYGAKHHESIFTKFFQTYYLPHKFGYNKKRAHLSSLIVSGLTDRETAMKEMEKNDVNNMDEDIAYVAKKLDMTSEEIKEIINRPKKSYKDYPSNEKLFKLGFKIRNFLRI